MGAEPVDKALYNRVKASVKKKVKVWPSAYASSLLVKEYKRKGGKYKGKKPSKDTGLQRWYDEKWINVCELPKKVSCGRSEKLSLKDWKKKYPYCRPSKEISSVTPKTASSLSKAEINRRCVKKRKSPSKRVIPKSRKSPKKRR